ncbi:MAG: addiction module protein [Chthoniobacterales bacterium]
MPATLDLKQMSRPEKVRLMEEIWQDLSADEQEVESPSWHGEVIAERIAKVEEGKATFLTLEELQARLTTKSS